MVLLVLGLADEVRRQLAATDIDAVVSAGARMALSHGFDRGRIDAAMTVASNSNRRTIDHFICEKSRSAQRCARLPPGDYVRIAAQTDVPSLFGAFRSPIIDAVAIVRLP